MKRRRLLLLALGGGVGSLVGASYWLTAALNPIAGMPNLASVRHWLTRLQAADRVISHTEWSVPQVLEHLAQSVEYSMSGFPQTKPVWFKASVGRLAHAVFQRSGRMRHDLQAPIPGAAALREHDLTAAAQRLVAALDAFAGFPGPLKAHFAYGELDHSTYLRAHLMHIADHAAEIELRS